MTNIHNNKVRITIQVTSKEMEFIDKLINEGYFLNRNDLMREAVRGLRREFKKEITWI